MEDLKARAVNCDLILLYWDIGRGIVEKQQQLGWGDSVVEIVAHDLRQAFPAMAGFSPANVWRMRQFHMVYSSEAFLAQVAREFEKRTHSQGSLSFLGQVVPETKIVQMASDKSPILAQAVRELAAAAQDRQLAQVMEQVGAHPA